MFRDEEPIRKVDGANFVLLDYNGRKDDSQTVRNFKNLVSQNGSLRKIEVSAPVPIKLLPSQYYSAVINSATFVKLPKCSKLLGECFRLLAPFQKNVEMIEKGFVFNSPYWNI